MQLVYKNNTHFYPPSIIHYFESLYLKNRQNIIIHPSPKNQYSSPPTLFKQNIRFSMLKTI